jgi:hypothetical protein
MDAHLQPHASQQAKGRQLGGLPPHGLQAAYADLRDLGGAPGCAGKGPAGAEGPVVQFGQPGCHLSTAIAGIMICADGGAAA